MNPNTRKRHMSTPKCEQCPDTRHPGEPRTRADRKADKNRLFTPVKATKESDNMQRIDHTEFKTYTSPTGRIRVPRSRLAAPRQCMPDGFTISITRKRAAQMLRDMRRADNNTPLAVSEARIPSGLDKAHAALVRKAKRNLGLADNTGSRKPCNAVRKATARTRKGKKVQPRTLTLPDATVMTPSPAGKPLDNAVASYLWQAWMRTSQKLTFQQYMDRWVISQTG